MEDDTVVNPHRAQISQFELFEFLLLLELDKQLPVGQFEAIISQLRVLSAPLTSARWLRITVFRHGRFLWFRQTEKGCTPSGIEVHVFIRGKSLKIHQRGVQWKQGVVIDMMLCYSLLYHTTPIHCTPLPLHPPVMNAHSRNWCEVLGGLGTPTSNFWTFNVWKLAVASAPISCLATHCFAQAQYLLGLYLYGQDLYFQANFDI